MGRALRRAERPDRRPPSADGRHSRPVVRRARGAAPFARAHLLPRRSTGVSREGVPRGGMEEPEHSTREVGGGEPEPDASGCRGARRPDRHKDHKEKLATKNTKDTKKKSTKNFLLFVLFNFVLFVLLVAQPLRDLCGYLPRLDPDGGIEPDAQHRALWQLDFLPLGGGRDAAAADDGPEDGALHAAEDAAEHRADAGAGRDLARLALD